MTRRAVLRRRPHRRRASLAAAAVAAFLVGGPTPAWAIQPAVATPEAAGSTVGRLLATELARLVRTVTATPVPTPAGLRAGVVLAEMAAEADPADPENWRLLLAAARTAEDEVAAARAREELGRLAPEDDVVALARLSAAVEERGNTLESRLEFLQFLIDAGRERRLTPATAARIAFEQGLLKQRAGDVRGFAEALLASLEFDPSFVAAARTALDFFAARVDDPVDEAELYLNLVLADPANPVILEGVGRLLMREGAYTAAARIYGMAIDTLAGGAAFRQDVAENLIADRALALWAGGRVADAVRVIEDRERFKQDLIQAERERRRRQEQIEPGSTAGLPPIPERLPLDLSLSAVRIAILAVEGPAASMDLPPVRAAARRQRAEAEGAAADPPTEDWQPRDPAEAHDALLTELRAALSERYDRYIEAADAEARPEAPLAAAALRLDHAWAACSLLLDPETARRRVAEAAEQSPEGLSDAAAGRFEGWIRLREGDPAGAIERLEPLAGDDPLAGLGLALALAAGGDADASRAALEAVAEEARGTITGVVARRRLQLIHGAELKPSPTAARLEGLMATVPAALDRLAWNQAGGLGMRVSFRERRIDAFDPVMLDITLTNNGPVPLSLDPAGPVVPTVLLVPEIVLPTGAVAPVVTVIDVHRRLRLDRRERITIPVDLRRMPIGGLLSDAAESGATIRVEAFINHDVASGGGRPVFYPRAISANAESGYLRIEGMPLQRAVAGGGLRRAEELAAMISAVASFGEGRPVPLETFGIVNRIALTPIGPDTPPVIAAARRDAAAAMVDAFPRLAPREQAWLVATSPPGVTLPQYRVIVETSDDPRLMAAWMVNMVGQVDDPVLLASLDSEDSRVRRVAEAVDERLRRLDLDR